MNWTSWQEFWSMGGRGEFVWGAYSVVAIAVVVEILVIRARLARARRDGIAARKRRVAAPPP